MRPAAAEWDEREETPWPIIQEAAKIGLYGFEALAQFCADPTGLTLPIVNEELFWGDAGIGMAIMGTVARRRRRSSASGTPRADRRVDPAVLRHAGRPEGRRVLRLRARRRLRRLLAAHARALRRGHGRVGPQRPEGVGDQRRHRRTSTSSSPRSTPSSARAARPRSSIPPGHARASRWARRSRSTACAPRTPPTSSSTTAASPAACLLGGKEKLDERLARAREGTRVAQRRPRWRPSRPRRPTVGAQALGIARAAYEYALDYAKEREQFGRRSSRTRRSRSRSPT